MDQSTPRVSIGMPVANGESWIGKSIDSILAQTFSDFELIICDNASSDRTAEICQEYAYKDKRVRFFRNDENLGAAKNFNRVFALARASYFKWAAHDDLLAPTYLERCVECLDQSPDSVVLCYPTRMLMTSEGKVIGEDTKNARLEAAPPFDRIGFARLMRVGGFLYPMLVFGLCRSSALRKTGLIGSYIHADLVLVTEMRLLGEFRQILEPLFFTRLHDITPERRSWQAGRGEADWYDPSGERRKLHPEVMLMKERFRAILNSHHDAFHKFYYCLCVFVGHALTRWPLWLGLLRRTPTLIWRRFLVGALRRPESSLVGFRLWAFVIGLRYLDSDLLSLALWRSSPESSTRLAGFAAERLAQRLQYGGDRDVESLVEEWSNHPDPTRRTTAEKVVELRGAEPG